MIEKIAKFCTIIGPENTSKVFQNLDSNTIEKISEKMMNSYKIETSEAVEILEEFMVLLYKSNGTTEAGLKYTKDVLYKSLGKLEADKILDKIKENNKIKNVFSYLKNIKAEQLIHFINKESSFTIAIVLSYLDPKKSAEVLNLFDLPKKVEIVKQISSLKDVQPMIVQSISDSLEKDINKITEVINVGGIDKISDILNKLDNTGEDILSAINLVNENLHDEIRANMFTFNDWLNSEEILEETLKEVELQPLAIALKETEDISTVLSYMSMRKQKALLEEIESVPKIKRVDLLAAQKTILDIANKIKEKI